MASGLNRYKRLQALGIDIKEGKQAKMPLSLITIPTEGPLAHPRANGPIDPKLVQDIVENGIINPVTVWEQVDDNGKPVFLLVDGSRRKRHGHEAEKLLKKQGSLPEGGLIVKVTFFEGTEIEFLLARQKADGDPLKLPHAPSEVAATFIQIRKFDEEYPFAKMRETCSKEYDSDRIVEALTRWKSLPKAVQDAFDNGLEIEGVVRPVPIGLLPGMDRFSKEDKLNALKELVAGRYKSFSGVTKFVNGKAFEAAIAAEEPEDVTDHAVEVLDDDDDGEPDKPEASASNGKARTIVPSAMVRKSWVKKVSSYLAEHKPPADVTAFISGALLDVEEEIDTAGMPQKLLAFIDGILWRRGIKVKVPVEVKDALRLADDKTPQGAPKRAGKKNDEKPGKAKKGKKNEKNVEA